MKNRLMDWRTWIRGLIGAIIGGAANSIAAIVLAPESFNFQDGLAKLGEFACYSGVIGAAMWLKQHPMPEDISTTTTTTTTTTSTNPPIP